MKTKRNQCIVGSAVWDHPREVVLKNDLNALQKEVSIGYACQGLIEAITPSMLPAWKTPKYTAPQAHTPAGLISLLIDQFCVDDFSRSATDAVHLLHPFQLNSSFQFL